MCLIDIFHIATDVRDIRNKKGKKLHQNTNFQAMNVHFALNKGAGSNNQRIDSRSLEKLMFRRFPVKFFISECFEFWQPMLIQMFVAASVSELYSIEYSIEV